MSNSLADGSVTLSDSLLWEGDSTVVARVANSAFFFRLNETPQLLARFANVLLEAKLGIVEIAVALLAFVFSVGASGDARGT